MAKAEFDIRIDSDGYKAMGIWPVFDGVAYGGLIEKLAGDQGLALPPTIQLAPHKPPTDGVNSGMLAARTIKPRHGYSQRNNTITVLTTDDVLETNQRLLHETGKWAVDVMGYPTKPESVRAAATAGVFGAIACITAGVELGHATHSAFISGLTVSGGLAFYTDALIRSTRRQQKAEVQKTLANVPTRFGNIITFGRMPETR